MRDVIRCVLTHICEPQLCEQAACNLLPVHWLCTVNTQIHEDSTFVQGEQGVCILYRLKTAVEPDPHD